MTWRKKSVAACCSNWKRWRMELLVSGMTPARSGRVGLLREAAQRSGTKHYIIQAERLLLPSR